MKSNPTEEEGDGRDDLPSANPASIHLWGRIRKAVVRNVLRAFGVLAVYLLLAVIGLIPVNRDFVQPEDGVTIFVESGPVHADLILPIETEVIDWRTHFSASDFQSDTSRSSHVAVGWGDRGFYLETPYWSDLRLSVAANAMLLPSRTVMHVRFTSAFKSSSRHPVTISQEQYERLVEFVLGSFKRQDGHVSRIESYAYGRNDAFYEAVGSYHALNTCNCWVGNGLKRAGIKVPWFSPLPGAVSLYLADEASQSR